MKISALNSIGFKHNPDINNKVQKNNSSNYKTHLTNTQQLAIGLSGAVALGFATYFIFRGKIKPKKISEKVLNVSNSTNKYPSVPPEKKREISQEEQKLIYENPKIIELLNNFRTYIDDKGSRIVSKLKNSTLKVEYSHSSKGKPDYMRDILIFDNDGKLKLRYFSKYDKEAEAVIHRTYRGSEEEIFAVLPDQIDAKNLTTEVFAGISKPFVYEEGTERTIRIISQDHSPKTIQNFYRNGKLYESYVYVDKQTEKEVNSMIVRYNYAYENGKVIAVAKQDLLKDGHQHGIFVNGLFEPFPIFIRYISDKEYKQIENIFTFERLCERDSRFDPLNL